MFPGTVAIAGYLDCLQQFTTRDHFVGMLCNIPEKVQFLLREMGGSKSLATVLAVKSITKYPHVKQR